MQPRLIRGTGWLTSHKLTLWVLVIWLALLVISLAWGPVGIQPSVPAPFPGSD